MFSRAALLLAPMLLAHLSREAWILKAAAETQAESRLPTNPTVALDPVTSVPQDVSLRLVHSLDAALQPAKFDLLNYAGANGDYRLQGSFKILKQKSNVKLFYQWDVYDTTGAHVGKTSGTRMMAAIGGDAWNSVTDPTLEFVAEQGTMIIPGAGKAGPVLPQEAASEGLPQKLAASPVKAKTSASYDSAMMSAAISERVIPEEAMEALRLVNEYRKSKKLHPLTLDKTLTIAASLLAADMSTNDHLSHYGPDGADLEKRLKVAGYNYTVAAENLGAGQKSVTALIDDWKRQPSESRNLLLPDATQMGIAFKYRPEANWKTFWAVVIASRS